MADGNRDYWFCLIMILLLIFLFSERSFQSWDELKRLKAWYRKTLRANIAMPDSQQYLYKLCLNTDELYINVYNCENCLFSIVGFVQWLNHFYSSKT